MKKFILIATLIIAGLTSCKKTNLPDPGKTAVQNLANEWWVMLTSGGSDIYGLGHFKIATYNSAANSNLLWVDDFQNGYGFKVKALADPANLTFAAKDSANLYYDPAHPGNYPQTVTITGGKVFPNQGRSKTGNVTDSIYMQITFAGDPTNYVISGTARTRWAEDDY